MKTINYDEVKDYIEKSSLSSAVYVGCDSLQERHMTRFGLVIVVHIDGCHGGHVFSEVITTPKIVNIKQRMLKEVEFIVEAATKVADWVGDRKFELHIDINPDPQHKSSVAYKDAMGWIQGMGFNVAAKPSAFCSSFAADNVVRH